MFTRILLAIDDSASSEAAVSFATAMARQSSAAVRVVHVNEYLVGGRGYTVETQGEAIQHLESAVNSLRAAGIPTEGSLYLTSCFGVEAQDYQFGARLVSRCDRARLPSPAPLQSLRR